MVRVMGKEGAFEGWGGNELALRTAWVARNIMR